MVGKSKKTIKKEQAQQRRTKIVAWGGVGCVLLIVAVRLVYLNLWLTKPILPKPALKDAAAKHGIMLAMHVKPNELSNKTFTTVLTSQYNVITDDGDVHWDKFRPTPNAYNFTELDTVVAYAKAQGMGVQVHHLVWNEDDSLPAWLKSGHYTKDELMGILRDHITTTVGHYKGDVQEWTVVNEPFTRAKHVYGLDNWWGDHLGGNEYIDQAFRWAHQADPKATLILNDFNNEVENDISNDQYNYTKAALARGVPITGTGMQMHIDASNPPKKADMIKNMQRFGALGVPVYITEFDINSSFVHGNAAYKAQLEAGITADVASACVESGACKSITVFGMTDVYKSNSFTHAKKRSNLLTSRYKLKPAYYALQSALQQP